MSNITGVEYDGVAVNDNESDYDSNVPCAVCNTQYRTSLLMLPANPRYPDSTWTLEYRGFLMISTTQPESGQSEWDKTKRHSEYVCVDENPKPVPGMGESSHGSVLSKTLVKCTGGGTIGNYPPYVSSKTIAVCSK